MAEDHYDYDTNIYLYEPILLPAYFYHNREIVKICAQHEIQEQTMNNEEQNHAPPPQKAMLNCSGASDTDIVYGDVIKVKDSF